MCSCNFRRLGFILFLLVFAALTSSAQSQTVTVLHDFSGSDGTVPYGALLQGTDGNFYGVTRSGGANGYGTIYKMTLKGVVTPLYAFPGGAGGFSPYGSLTEGPDGNFYGSTAGGGVGDGVVFKISPVGAFTLLHTFAGYGESDGSESNGGLVLGADGDFYGTTYYGGPLNYGTVFKITPAGSLTILHSFQFGTDGAYPGASLVLGSDGNFYGTTEQGGANGDGTVFKITPAGSLTPLHQFSSLEGGNCMGRLVEGADSNFYGTANNGSANGYGSVFKVTPSGSLSVLHAFTADPDGANPVSGLLLAKDGNFYGATYDGGTSDYGTLFKITPGGVLTKLYDFAASKGGYYPNTEMIQATDGNFYGATSGGGTIDAGTIYRLSLAPVITSLVPSSTDAGGPAFTLIVNGKLFDTNNTVYWGNTALSTTYVSATQLKATVSTSLIANVGSVKITIHSPSFGASAAKTYTILLTTLQLASASLTKNSDGSYTASLILKNIGYKTAPSVAITQASLGAVATSTTLPVSLGNLSAGSSSNTSLKFPASAGASGTTVTLKISGTFTGGKFSGSLKVKLP